MKKLLAPLLLCLVLAGCSQNPKPVVGAANQFDSDSYLTLVTADSTIQATKAALTAGSFPANVADGIKVALNGLITAYDVANPTYIAYHNAALAGQATAQQQQAVQSQISSVQSATVALTTAKAGN